VHAAAPSLRAPFEVQDVAFRPFSHEPTVARAPTGEYVMWFTSADWGPTGAPPVHGHKVCDCTSASGLDECGWSNLDGKSGLPTFMSFAKRPEGPWSEPVLIPIHGRGDTNLAAFILPDGSVRGMGRTCMFRADNWRVNTTYRYYCNTTGVMGEDPFVWMDAEGIFHMIRHCNTTEDEPATHGQPYGTHQWSLDGGFTWKAYGEEHAYPTYANFSDGSSLTYTMRERPHLVFADDGTPLALTTGAAPNTQHNQLPGSCRFKIGGDCRTYSYTMLQLLEQDSEHSGTSVLYI
jgi:hypothetical protein